MPPFFSPRSLRVAEPKSDAATARTQVRLRSFSTNRHKVQGLVAYRLGQDVL